MVGKLSDMQKMSGSRIPVLYCWRHAEPHPYSTPNEELRKSIDAKHRQADEYSIGEPGIVGNLLEPTLIANCVEELGLPTIVQSPPVVKHDLFEVSMDGLSRINEPLRVTASEIVQILIGGEPVDQVDISGMVPIEVKCTSDYPCERPPLYRGPVQLQMQMMSVDAEFGIIITLHRGIERRITIYNRNEEMQAEIERLCAEFSKRVAAEDYYPPVTVSDAAIAPADEEKSETDISDLDDAVDALTRLREDKREIEKQIEDTELKIMRAIGTHNVGITPRYRVEWPVRHYKATPEKVTPAKEARTIRLKSLKIKPIM